MKMGQGKSLAPSTPEQTYALFVPHPVVEQGSDEASTQACQLLLLDMYTKYFSSGVERVNPQDDEASQSPQADDVDAGRPLGRQRRTEENQEKRKDHFQDEVQVSQRSTHLPR